MQMGSYDQTSMGGQRETFFTTHWSLIKDIQTEQDKDRSLIGMLMELYWKPVYSYLHRKGYDNEQAKDLTQGFFHEVVLNRNLVHRADQCKGRFRSFLLHALNQYTIDQKRKDSSNKQIPKEKLVSLDIFDEKDLPHTAFNLSPVDCFNYTWKSVLLDRTLSEVETKCLKEEMETHWFAFRDRIVEPILKGIEPSSLKEICSNYDIKDERTASNMVITVKRRFKAVLKKNLRSTVISENQINDELKDILELF